MRVRRVWHRGDEVTDTEDAMTDEAMEVLKMALYVQMSLWKKAMN